MILFSRRKLPAKEWREEEQDGVTDGQLPLVRGDHHYPAVKGEQAVEGLGQHHPVKVHRGALTQPRCSQGRGRDSDACHDRHRISD